MLDTNICIYIINQQPIQVLQRFALYNIGDIAISSICVAELAFGVEKSGSKRNKLALEKFLSPLKILPFSERAMWDYAQIRHELERKGQKIGELDMLIAGHALSEDLILVTNNVGEFSRISQLKVENWV